MYKLTLSSYDRRALDFACKHDIIELLRNCLPNVNWSDETTIEFHLSEDEALALSDIVSNELNLHNKIEFLNDDLNFKLICFAQGVIE